MTRSNRRRPRYWRLWKQARDLTRDIRARERFNTALRTTTPKGKP